MSASQGVIMAVDDTVANLKLLKEMLSKLGYETRCFPDPVVALKLVDRVKPDVILLDINMPKLNGYQWCLKVKAERAFKSTPVIFMSALSDTFNKVRGFEVGAVDYITKPFQFEELRVRLETHLKLSQVTRELDASLRRLRDLEERRDNFINMLVHDLNQPLNVINGFVSLLERSFDDDANEQKFLNAIQSSSNRMQAMVNDLLAIRRLKEREFPIRVSVVNLDPILERLRNDFATNDKEVELELYTKPLAGVTNLQCDPDLIHRIVGNFVANAIRFSPNRGKVYVRAEVESEAILIEVEDSGSGVPAESLDEIFQLYKSVDKNEMRRRTSNGIGLNFCKLAAEALDGTVGVRNLPERGSVFWVRIPHSTPETLAE